MAASAETAQLTPEEAVASGMVLALHAQMAPSRPAIVSPHGDRTYGELNERANQLVRALRRAGLKEGDAVALLCANRPEFVETCAACARAGFRITPINWHLTGAEVGYICLLSTYNAAADLPGLVFGVAGYIKKK
ncbi:MAG: AMP-binding protein, partial [Kangiella sp.]|nr:AMP-binding protein [Kangiella sp.]